MASKVCKIGCTCGRHRPGSTIVYKRTAQHKVAAILQQRPDTAARNAQPRRLATRLAASQTLTERWPERRAATSGGKRRTSGYLGYTGGDTGNAFFAVLGPVGYVREHIIRYGPATYDRYKVDFAHLLARVVIELDGPYHQATEEADACRDARLRELGWRVIRIHHD